MKKLGLLNGIVGVMLDSYHFSVQARRMGVPCEDEPDFYKQEALKYAKMFGDSSVHLYNKNFNN